MKNLKKIGYLLAITACFIFAGLIAIEPSKAEAYSQKGDIASCLQNLHFVDIAHIQCTDGQGNTIVFTDNNPTDTDKASHNYAPADGAFCTPSTKTIVVGGSNKGGGRNVTSPVYTTDPGGIGLGIYLNISGLLNVQVASQNLSSIGSTTHLTYPIGSNCAPYGTPANPAEGDTVKLPTPDISQAQNAKKLLQWQNAKNLLQGQSDGSIASLAGVTGGSLNGKNYTRIKGQDPGGSNTSLLFGQNIDLTKCQGSVLAVAQDGSSAIEYSLKSANGAASPPADLKRLLTGNSCDVSSTNFGMSTLSRFKLGGNAPSLSGDTTGTAGQLAASGTTTDSGSTTGLTAQDDCAQSNVFAWMICPMLDIAQKGSNALIGLFESQLSFTVNDLGQGSGGSNSVHTAWSIIRTIASIALVVVMLVMVLSQATSWGSIDAYTVRKMLPRLVVAVILIQVSWNMFGFLLTAVNDISKGLADLMYYPFGGSANMDLGSLLHNAHVGTGGANSAAWTAGLLGAAGVGVILGVAAAPAVLAFVVTATFALLTGLVALMFRKILIIACLIFSPLALLLWILPGTQKYWKIWWDNFTKALMMFPIVVAIVASGRIFAWVAGTQNTSANFSVLLNFIIVMVGYFGPLFILPKTFKWGGSLMNSAGSTITNTVKPLSELSSKGAHGYAERVQGRIAKSYNPDKDAKGNGRWNRFSRRIAAGNPNVFSARSQNLAIQKGDKWNSEEDELATARTKRGGEKAQDNGYETEIRDDDGNQLSATNLVQDADGNYLDKDGEIAYAKQENGSYKEVRDGVVGDKAVMDANGNLRDENGEVTHIRQADGTYTTTAADGTTQTVDGASALSAHFENAMHAKATQEEINAGQTHKRTLYSVAAMKQYWVDLADSKDKHISKMAIRQLTATSSWPELQGSFTKDGKKVMDTKAWKGSITTSPEDYPRVLRSRVDAAPHLVTSAEAAATAKGLKEDTPAFRSFVQAKRMDLAINKQMSNEDFQTQSDGFWDDAARLSEQRVIDPVTGQQGDYTPEAKSIRKGLKQRFEAIAAAGGNAPQQMLGHLVGGAVQSSVDKALGSGVSVGDYLERGKQTGGAGNPSTVWKETLPPAADITVTAADTGNLRESKEQARAGYKSQLLNTTNPRAADALAQGLAYADQIELSVPQAEREAHIKILRELHDSSLNSPETAPIYNSVIQKVRATAQARVDEAVRKAVTDGLDTASVERIKQTATAQMAQTISGLPPLIPGYDTPRPVRPGTTPPTPPPTPSDGGDLAPGDEVDIGGHPV